MPILINLPANSSHTPPPFQPRPLSLDLHITQWPTLRLPRSRLSRPSRSSPSPAPHPHQTEHGYPICSRPATLLHHACIVGAGPACRTLAPLHDPSHSTAPPLLPPQLPNLSRSPSLPLEMAAPRLRAASQSTRCVLLNVGFWASAYGNHLLPAHSKSAGESNLQAYVEQKPVSIKHFTLFLHI